MRDNSTSSVTTRDSSNINTTTTSINTTTTTTQSLRTATTTSIGSRTQSYNIDDVVKDVSIIPYIRSRIIQFYATIRRCTHILMDKTLLVIVKK